MFGLVMGMTRPAAPKRSGENVCTSGLQGRSTPPQPQPGLLTRAAATSPISVSLRTAGELTISIPNTVFPMKQIWSLFNCLRVLGFVGRFSGWPAGPGLPVWDISLGPTSWWLADLCRREVLCGV